ncbi:MAG TPA: NAD(P)H-hydrate dehydratase [Chitinophagaceae bacterium]|nr:NAD(P)H-hydrate dehydratase [Chitinophagaceae bacterium]
MIFTAGQIRAWDQFTIRNEPIASLDLMERAATECARWLEDHGYADRSFSIFCGKGNNGGDGLALARMLSAKGSVVTVYILEFGAKGTEDFQQNLARLHGSPLTIRFIQNEEHFPAIPSEDIIIDALLGSGLNRPLEGVTAALVNHINSSGNLIISIDIPSGLSADKSSSGNVIIEAAHTLSFQCYKPAFMVAENESYVGQVHILDIGLHSGFLLEEAPAFHMIDEVLARSIYKPRKRFSHKGTFGHALLVAGGRGKMGAAILAAKACLRSGVGLLTMQIPGHALHIMQTSVPEAMCMTDRNEHMHSAPPNDLTPYNVIGIGPGIGKEEPTARMLEMLLQHIRKPVVLDADALNILGTWPHILQLVPPGSVLTPHPKEFERMFGRTGNDFERIEVAVKQASFHQVVILLKGRHTFVASPSGKAYFNSTGNAGMATGGTGDVLTGIITGLIAQGYGPEQAAVLGVYWHGLAGDLVSGFYSQEALIASDIPDALGPALKKLLDG